MGFKLFDFNGDGKVSNGEGLFGALLGTLIASAAIEDCRAKQIGANVVAGKSIAELRATLSALDESAPPVSSPRRARWAEYRSALCSRIDEMETQKQQAEIDALRDKLDALEEKEPGNANSAAHDRWEERCDDLREQIDRLKYLL